MNQETQALLDSTLRFAINAIAFAETMRSNAAGQTVTRQLIRSATSIGANLREAQRSRTRVEFVSKIQICLQEASETYYWLQVVDGSSLGDQGQVQELLSEADRLVAIFVAITRTTKHRSSTDAR